MRSKEEINKLLTTPHLLPEARKLFEAELGIINDKEAKDERAAVRKRESKKFWISTMIAIVSSVIAIVALIVAILK